MCGIYGYIGNRSAFNIILAGLQKLEYRGYDSWGIVTLANGQFLQVKQLGYITRSNITETGLLGNAGIGHVRWATHGSISEKNAHPHFDCKSEIAIAHNGVIYNEDQIRNRLVKDGHIFNSDTDSELFAHLLEEKAEEDFINTIYECLKEIDAQYALLILNKKQSKIYATRKESPIKIGIAEEGYYISSDILSFVGEADRYIDLEDGDVAEIGMNGLEIYDKDKNPVKRELRRIDITPEMADKGQYLYFYLKETQEEKEVVKRITGTYIKGDKIDIGIDLEEIKDVERIIITGAGSSFFASMIGEYYLKRLARVIDVASIMSSQVISMYSNIDFSDKSTLLIGVTQSGETKDTLDAIRFLKRKRVMIITVANRPSSEAERESDFVIKQLAGPERSVVATKSFLAEVLVLLLFSIGLARVKDKEVENISEEVRKLPALVEHVFSQEKEIQEIAKNYQHEDEFYPLSRGINMPVALEIGRKMEEVLYVNTLGTSLGTSAELKHGPLTMISDKTLLFIAPFSSGSEYRKIITNIEEAKARGAKVIAVAIEGDRVIKNMVDDVIWIPETSEFLTPILSVIPLQLLTYYVGQSKNMESFDRPRNLAKSITVD